MPHQLGRCCGGSVEDCAPEDNAPENDAAACEAAYAAAVAAADEGSSAAVDCLLLSSAFAMSAATGCAAGADDKFGRVSSSHSQLSLHCIGSSLFLKHRGGSIACVSEAAANAHWNLSQRWREIHRNRHACNLLMSCMRARAAGTKAHSLSSPVAAADSAAACFGGGGGGWLPKVQACILLRCL